MNEWGFALQSSQHALCSVSLPLHNNLHVCNSMICTQLSITKTAGQQYSQNRSFVTNSLHNA